MRKHMKRQIPTGPAIPMSQFTLGPREDLLASVEIDGVVYTDRAAKLAEINRNVDQFIRDQTALTWPSGETP